MLALTCESASCGVDSDEFVSIEERRQETLESIDSIFEEISQTLSIEKVAQEMISEEDFLQKKERLLKWVDQIRDVDKKRATLIEEEQSVLALALKSLRLGKQATIQYQKSIPT